MNNSKTDTHLGPLMAKSHNAHIFTANFEKKNRLLK